MSPSENPATATGSKLPSLSVVIPAYNEAGYLEATLIHAKRAAEVYQGPVEIIVVDNNSTDGTADIARAQGVQVVFEPQNQIARARNAGAAEARGDYLVFVDADTHLEGDILGKVAANLASGEVIGGGAWVEPDSTGLGRLLFKYPVNFALGLANVSVGPFLYCDRESFGRIRGFCEEFYAAEEFVLARRMQAEGRKTGKSWRIIRPHKGHRIVTSSRRLGRFGGLEMALKHAHLLWKSDQKLRQKDQCSSWYQARS